MISVSTLWGIGWPEESRITTGKGELKPMASSLEQQAESLDDCNSARCVSAWRFLA